MENLVTKVQKLVVVALAVLLLVVVVLSTAHLGVLVVEEIWKPPRFLIPVQGLLDIFGFFLLVLGTAVFSSSTFARKSSVSKASASARCFSKCKSERDCFILAGLELFVSESPWQFGFMIGHPDRPVQEKRLAGHFVFR
jgi:hypothetical protein